MSARQLLLVGLQFGGFDFSVLCKKIGVDPKGEASLRARVFDGLVLGAGSSQFPHRAIAKDRKVWDDIREVLAEHGLVAPRVACHPLMMGAVARHMHPGYEPFLGDIYAKKSDGTPDEAEIHKRSLAEWEQHLCPAFQVAGIEVVQTFFGSSTHVDRSREFPRPSEAYLDDLEGKEIEVVRKCCDVAVSNGVKRVCDESHIGESHLSCRSQHKYYEKVKHPAFFFLHDGSHVSKLGGSPEDGIDYLTEHCPGSIGDVHLKGGGVRCSAGRIIDSWFPCGDSRRGSQYEAVHRHVETMIREVSALNRHEAAGGVALDCFALEHEDDGLEKVNMDDDHPALNAVMVSGKACREFLLFRGGESHQKAMAAARGTATA